MAGKNRFEDIEKAAELTATFLVPFILAFALFVARGSINSVSPLTYSEIVGYFIVLSKNMIIPVGSVLLTWLFLVVYYLFGPERLQGVYYRSPCLFLSKGVSKSNIGCVNFSKFSSFMILNLSSSFHTGKWQAEFMSKA